MVRPVNNGEPHNVGKPQKEQYSRELHEMKMATNDAGLGIINGPNSRAAGQTAKFAKKATREPAPGSTKAVLIAGETFRKIARNTPSKQG